MLQFYDIEQNIGKDDISKVLILLKAQILVLLCFIIIFVKILKKPNMIQEHQQGQRDQNQIDYQGYSLLERAIRLLRKNTHYELKDQIRGKIINVAYGIPYESSPCKKQHALKVFWRCLNTRFFKSIQDFDVQILKYYRLLINSPTSGTHNQIKFQMEEIQNFLLSLLFYLEASLPFLNPETYEIITNTLRKPIVSECQQLVNYQNLIYYIYLEFLCIQFQSSDKRQITKIKHLRREKYNYIPRMRLKPTTEEIQELQKERSHISTLIQKYQFGDHINQKDQISQEIALLEAELLEANEFNKSQFDKIIAKSNDQIMMKSLIYIINSEKEKQDAETMRDKILQEVSLYNQGMVKRIDLQKRYLQLTITELQYKQVSQSISKVSLKQKSNEEFNIIFQKGSALLTTVISEKQLRKMNKARDVSLLKYYNTSMKTRNYSISAFISGFQLLFKRKSIESIRNKDILQQIRDSKLSKDITIISQDTKKVFQSYDICHHCKQLYQSVYLTKCSYHSGSIGPPSQNLSFIDPYIQQIMNRQTLSSHRKFSNNQKNPYMNYNKKGNEYICQRKYCKFCLRQNYDALEGSNMCPFCQGICFCSRCLRNDNIMKLKTMYALLGGDVVKLNKQTNHRNDNSSIQQIENALTKNGSSLKYWNSLWKNISTSNSQNQLKVTFRQFLKLQDIRQELEQCRQVCQLVKRRQKQKLLILENEELIFAHTINDLDLDFKIGKRPRSGDGSTETEQCRKVKKTK